MHWCWYIVPRIHLNQQLSYQLDYMLRVEHKIAFEVIFVMFVLQKINKDSYVDKSPVVCFMVLRDVPLFFDWRGRDGKLIEKKGWKGWKYWKKIVCKYKIKFWQEDKDTQENCLQQEPHIKTSFACENSLPPLTPVQKIMVRLLGPRDQFKRRPFHVSNLIPIWVNSWFGSRT